MFLGVRTMEGGMGNNKGFRGRGKEEKVLGRIAPSVQNPVQSSPIRFHSFHSFTSFQEYLLYSGPAIQLGV